eukprot:784426_1
MENENASVQINEESKRQDVEADDSQLQIVKFKYGNVHLESVSKLEHRDFYFANTMIEIKQSGQNDRIATRVWDASIVLSHYLDRNAKELQIESKYILEIGAGLGLCSIVCSLLNAKHVYLTDIDPHCMELAQQNIQKNTCDDNVSVHKYFWGSDLNKTTMKRNQFDIIIGADCIYLKETYKSLLQTFIHIFHFNPNAIVILAFADRFHHQKIFYKSIHKNKSFVVRYIDEKELNIDLANTNKIMIITYKAEEKTVCDSSNGLSLSENDGK